MILLSTDGVTYAIKSKRILKKYGIEARIIKLDPKKTRNGCSYGIELDDEDLLSAVDKLKRNGISYDLYERNKYDLS